MSNRSGPGWFEIFWLLGALLFVVYKIDKRFERIERALHMQPAGQAEKP